MQPNPDLEYIDGRLKSMPAAMQPLTQLALRYLPRGYRVDDGAVRLGRHRKYEHDHYYITIFPPSVPEWLVRRRSFEVPLDYLQLLSHANGLTIFGIDLFGFTPSMQEDPPRLNRRKHQCLDITTANETWSIGYELAPRGSVFVGSRSYTSDQNSGYFMNENGSVCSLLKNGRLVGKWPSVWRLLSEEIEIEEAKLRV